MFTYNIEDNLKKKLKIIGKKNKTLAINFKKKLMEVISHSKVTINTYKNLKSPLNEYKRIHLTKNYILIFKVDINNKHIVFLEIAHRDKVYK
ncbi:MAG: type II toxin-antitoxin system RelE family toxin [Candidatus Woesearchaeota archaeon]